MTEIVAHFHRGPLAGETLVIDVDNPRAEKVLATEGGRYVRDELSAGGRCFDWQEAS